MKNNSPDNLTLYRSLNRRERIIYWILAFIIGAIAVPAGFFASMIATLGLWGY